jgi:hypothetical protein
MIWRRGLDDGGCEWSSSSNRFQQAYVQGFVDVSGGNVLLRAGPTNNNHLILQGGDISLNGRLNVATGTSASVYNNFYGKVPPTTSTTSTYALPTFSPNSTKATSSSWSNSGVTWTSSASNYATSGASNYPYYLFDTSTNMASRWVSSNSSGNYSGSTGIYVGTSVGTAILNSVGTQYGEWIQIQSSTPIVMNNFTMSSWGTTTSAYSEMPGAFFICGSNDNINWYPLIYIKFTGTQISSGQTTPVYTIPSGTSGTVASPTTTGTNVSPSGNLNYATFGNGTNSYFYFRMVITQQMGSITSGGTNDGWLSFSEWTPVFTFFSTAATQTGPSRALIYMDPSNINQVDVSGSLGLINSSPPSTMMVTPNTTAATSSTWVNNNVSWTVSASSTYATISAGNGDPYRVFDNTLVNSGNRWLSGAGNVYSTTAPYNYIAAVPFNTSVTGITTGVTQNISGEWVQIQSSIPLILNSYNIANDDVTGRTIKTFYIVASNDQNNWFPIQSGTSSTNPYGANTMSYVSPTTNFSLTGGTTQNGFTVTTYSNYTGNAYTYFRIIITNNYGGLAAAIGEWLINFTPTASSVSLALDNATPNQLNIGGSLNINGLTLGGPGPVFVSGTNTAASPAADAIGQVIMTSYFPTVIMPQGTLFLVRLSSTYVASTNYQQNVNLAYNINNGGWSYLPACQHFANTDYTYFGDMVPFYNAGGQGPIQFGVSFRFFSNYPIAGTYPTGCLTISVYKIF